MAKGGEPLEGLGERDKRMTSFTVKMLGYFLEVSKHILISFVFTSTIGNFDNLYYFEKF